MTKHTTAQEKQKNNYTAITVWFPNKTAKRLDRFLAKVRRKYGGLIDPSRAGFLRRAVEKELDRIERRGQ